MVTAVEKQFLWNEYETRIPYPWLIHISILGRTFTTNYAGMLVTHVPERIAYQAIADYCLG